LLAWRWGSDGEEKWEREKEEKIMLEEVGGQLNKKWPCEVRYKFS